MKSRLFASMAVVMMAAGMLASCCGSNRDCCEPCPCPPPRPCKPICCPAPKACCVPVAPVYQCPPRDCYAPGPY